MVSGVQEARGSMTTDSFIKGKRGSWRPTSSFMVALFSAVMSKMFGSQTVYPSINGLTASFISEETEVITKSVTY